MLFISLVLLSVTGALTVLSILFVIGVTIYDSIVDHIDARRYKRNAPLRHLNDALRRRHAV